MSRLIYAERLKEVLKINFGHTGGAAVLSQLIDNQPTAYDIDKVIEQLKDSSRTYCEEYKQRENNLYLLDAIEIVKKGGAE